MKSKTLSDLDTGNFISTTFGANTDNVTFAYLVVSDEEILMNHLKEVANNKIYTLEEKIQLMERHLEIYQKAENKNKTIIFQGVTYAITGSGLPKIP